MDWWPSPFLWEYDGIRTCGTFIVRTCVSKQIPKKWTTLALCDAHVGRLTHGDLWLSLGPSKICHVSLTFKVPTSRVVFLLPLTDNCYLRNLHSPKYSNTIINHHPKSGCELTATNPLTIPELPWLGSVWYAVPGTSHTFSSLMNMIMPCSVDQGSFLAGEPQVQHGNEGNVPPMRSKIHQTSGNNQDLGKNWGISDAGWWCLMCVDVFDGRMQNWVELCLSPLRHRSVQFVPWSAPHHWPCKISAAVFLIRIYAPPTPPPVQRNREPSSSNIIQPFATCTENARNISKPFRRLNGVQLGETSSALGQLPCETN